MSGQKNNKALRWFLGVTIFVSFGVGIYSLYEYLRIQKINKSVTSPEDAIAQINGILANG